MSTCFHQWQKVYEETLFGGLPFPIRWQCKLCNASVHIYDVPIGGIGGTDTGEQVLFGPHGGRSHTSDGTPFTKQVRYPDGRLEIIP